jgi:hypothetical protein
MIKKSICIKNYQDRTTIGGTYKLDSNWNKIYATGMTYNEVSGVTSGGTIGHYTTGGTIEMLSGSTNDTFYLATFNILLTQTIDDIGYYTPDTSEYVPNTSYNVGNYSMNDGNSYICINGNTDTGFTETNWKKTPNNEWTSGTTYYSGDYTYFNGSGYTCTNKHVSGQSFDNSNWQFNSTDRFHQYQVIYTGETKIDQFRRYGKTDTDPDLYNSLENSGFTHEKITSNGLIEKIIAERENTDNLAYQPLYDYQISISGYTGTTINYSDIGSDLSEISYITRGLTEENAIKLPIAKLDYLIGVVSKPKMDIDVFIDRGDNSAFDRHIRLGDFNSFTELESYGNGFYTLKED